MVSILIDHHNRLGDHLTMNGLVREYCKRYDRVGIFCLPRFRRTISFMFRDLPNLRIENAPTHRAKTYFHFWNHFRFGERHYDTIVLLYDDLESGIMPELQFYKAGGVPHEKKWTSFHVERDHAREARLLEKVQLPEQFIFLHDDHRFPIDRTRIESPLLIFKPDESMTDNIFDYCAIIERAEEIHVIDSSLMFLADLLPYENLRQKLFVHRYARPNPEWNLPILKKNWQIIV